MTPEPTEEEKTLIMRILEDAVTVFMHRNNVNEFKFSMQDAQDAFDAVKFDVSFEADGEHVVFRRKTDAA